MKETINVPGDNATTDVSKKSGPQGIGMAVALAWGLSVQILVTPFLALIPGVSSPLGRFNLAPAVAIILALPPAALFAIFGEGVRRGWKWTRPVEIVFNSLLFIAGLAGIVNLWQSIRHGNYWPIVTESILLIVAPLIVWRLSRPQTAQWFATVTSSEARQRHGGIWPFFIALCAIIGGILQALVGTSK